MKKILLVICSHLLLSIGLQDRVARAQSPTASPLTWPAALPKAQIKVPESRAQDITITAVDDSRSAAIFFGDVGVEVRQIIKNAPEHMILCLIRTSAPSQIICTTPDGGTSRLDLYRALDLISPTAWQSDLGATIDRAARQMARYRGVKRLMIWSDGVPAAGRSSQFYGRSIDSLLADTRLIPDEVELFFRLFGPAQFNVQRPNVRLLRAAPDAREIYRVSADGAATAQPDLPRSESNHPGVKTTSTKSWFIVAGLVACFLVLITASFWRFRRGRIRASRLARDETQMRKSVAPGLTKLSDEHSLQPPRRVVVIDNLATGETARLAESQPSMVIGDYWDSSLPLTNGGGACAKVFWSARAWTGLAIANCGSSDVFVGERKIAPGQTHWLPEGPLEIALGGQVLHLRTEAEIIEAFDGEVVKHG